METARSRNPGATSGGNKKLNGLNDQLSRILPTVSAFISVSYIARKND